jgi:hypothetical protein
MDLIDEYATVEAGAQPHLVSDQGSLRVCTEKIFVITVDIFRSYQRKKEILFIGARGF